MRKIALAAVAALALPISVPAMAQQNNAKQNPPAQQSQQQLQSNQGSGQQGQQLSQNEVRQIQQKLDQKGFSSGRTDGKLGPETKTALRDFQKKNGLQQTGQPDQQTLAKLGMSQSSTTGQGSSNEPMQDSQSPPAQNQPANNSGANGK